MQTYEAAPAWQRELIKRTAGMAAAARAKRADYTERVAELTNLRAVNDRPLDIEDFKAAGADEKIPPAHIHAVANVESPSRGFENGRAVVMVEPHIFSALSAHAFDGPRYGCSYPAQVRYQKGAPPPPGFNVHPYAYGQDERWGLFANMALLDIEAAIGAVSLGRFQQVVGSPRPDMGWKLLRYGSAEELFRKLCRSEADQFEIFVRFFRANGALDILRAGNWRAIARVYNGPGNVEAYAARMQTEYARVARHYG